MNIDIIQAAANMDQCFLPPSPVPLRCSSGSYILQFKLIGNFMLDARDPEVNELTECPPKHIKSSL